MVVMSVVVFDVDDGGGDAAVVGAEDGAVKAGKLMAVISILTAARDL